MNRAGPARILIVTSGPLCRNPRVLKEATSLGAAGYDVIVLTVANVAAHENFDRELMRSAPFRKSIVNHLSPHGLARARSFVSRGLTWAARHATRVGIPSDAAFGPAWALRRRARRFAADLTIVHTELGFAVGSSLLHSGRRVAADFEDWHSRDLMPEARRGRPLRRLRRHEAHLLRSAALVTTTSDALADALAKEHGTGRPIVIRNVFPLQDEPPPRPRTLPAFFWFSQTIGPGRMLELFLAAWGLTQTPSRLALLGDISPSYRRQLETLAGPRHRDRIEFLPTVRPAELPGVIARHHIGLAIEPPVPDSRNLTITNKLFQYLNAGLAIIASPTAGQSEVLAAAPEAGFIADPSQTTAFARRLDEIAADPEATARMGAGARRAAAARFCWEKESPKLVAAVQAALP